MATRCARVLAPSFVMLFLRWVRRSPLRRIASRYLGAGQAERDQGDIRARGESARRLPHTRELLRSLLSDDHDDGNSSPVHDGGSGGRLQPDTQPSARVKTRTPDRSRLAHSRATPGVSVECSAAVSRGRVAIGQTHRATLRRTRTSPHSRRGGSLAIEHRDRVPQALHDTPKEPLPTNLFWTRSQPSESIAQISRRPCGDRLARAQRTEVP